MKLPGFGAAPVTTIAGMFTVVVASGLMVMGLQHVEFPEPLGWLSDAATAVAALSAMSALPLVAVQPSVSRHGFWRLLLLAVIASATAYVTLLHVTGHVVAKSVTVGDQQVRRSFIVGFGLSEAGLEQERNVIAQDYPQPPRPEHISAQELFATADPNDIPVLYDRTYPLAVLGYVASVLLGCGCVPFALNTLRPMPRPQTVEASAGGLRALEKFVGPNTTMLDADYWLIGGIVRGRLVCRVDRDGEGVGTGFLVGPDLLLTCYHVVEGLIMDPTSAARWTFRFDHHRSRDGLRVEDGRAVSLAHDWHVDSSPYSRCDVDPQDGEPSDDELDFALLRLASRVGDDAIDDGGVLVKRGWIRLDPTPVAYDGLRVVAILQHPSAGPMKLALSVVESLAFNGRRNRVRYGVPTLPGSSGSPVFDGSWNLIAIHHSGDPAFVPRYNQAIPIDKITVRPRIHHILRSPGDQPPSVAVLSRVEQSPSA